MTILFMGLLLLNQPEKIDAENVVVLPIIEQGSSISLLNYLYYYMATASYVITWVITGLLLKDYIKKVGKIKYWIRFITPIGFLP